MTTPDLSLQTICFGGFNLEFNRSLMDGMKELQGDLLARWCEFGRERGLRSYQKGFDQHILALEFWLFWGVAFW